MERNKLSKTWAHLVGVTEKNTNIKHNVYVQQQLSNICLFLDVNNYNSQNASPMI